jgi:single-strand DNA-binding protein
MNKWNLLARLTKDPESGVTKNGTPAVDLDLAYNWKSKEDEKVDYFKAKAYGKTAETIGLYFKKGDRILLSGKVQTETWKDDAGNNRKSFYMVISNFDFIERKNN